MRVVVTGATGNVGTSLVGALAADPDVREVVGIARRRPSWGSPKTTWQALDVAAAPLEPVFEGADAVVHLAWLIQPSRDERELFRVNVDGSRRVFEAAAAAGVPVLVHASSVGAYARGPKDRLVDESWPTDGIPSSFYSRHKVAAERALDEVEAANPDMRVVRLRPALIFKREAGTEVRRLFIGPFLPSPLLRPRLVRVVPRIRGLRLQAVHSEDVADAYRRAVLDDRAHGAYNVAADPVLDPDTLARELHAVQVPLSPRVARAAAALTWKARLQPTPPGWVDMGLQTPLLDTARIRRELGWAPGRSSLEALRDLLDGISRGAGLGTPPLDPATSGPLRAREILTGLGRRPGVGGTRS